MSYRKSIAAIAFPDRVRSRKVEVEHAKPHRWGKRIRAVSKVQAKLNQEDADLLRVWWKDPANWYCACCKRTATDRHHARGRTRMIQNDQRWWVPLCRECHDAVRDRPAWARLTVVFRGTPREQTLLPDKGGWRKADP